MELKIQVLAWDRPSNVVVFINNIMIIIHIQMYNTIILCQNLWDKYFFFEISEYSSYPIDLKLIAYTNRPNFYFNASHETSFQNSRDRGSNVLI